ncbi:MAG: ATP-binding protein, partial [Nitrospirota bacterium]
DTGPGVPPDIISKLFEPFYTTKAQGTGLGLFLSAEMARTMGGSLHYIQSLEGGARFELHLPW